METDLFGEIEKRTKLAFSNQMEMFVFYLTDNQMYGINVFKIIEVIECPKTVIKVPNSHPNIKGTIDFRGKAVIVIDIGEFLGLPAQDFRKNLSYVIICEYNNNIQGLLVNNTDTLMTRSWEDIKSPSGMLNSSGYLTAIAYNDNNRMVQILDIEKMLVEILGMETSVSEEVLRSAKTSSICKKHVLVIDDSKAARGLIQSVLEQLNFTFETYESASEAMEMLQQAGSIKNKYCMIICDIEMPGIDGFTFTRKAKANPNLKDTYILLHSSMSNPANQDKAKQVGADGFIPKFQPNILAQKIIEIVNNIEENL
ncbi:chemotaxis protein CheW [Candidatus Magnetoovum chiemensis]|nr:chemotaxis protein CheW [Candidatus Magnetoovum chiemensis]